MRILPTNPVERKAAQAILTHALLRWETQAGVFVAVAALVILPDPWKPVAVLGLAVGVWSVLRSLGDASLNAQVALGALETDVRISELTTPSYQALLKEALENDRRIRQLLLGLKEGPLKAQAEMRVADIDGWIRNMYAFARGSEELRRQGAFAEDLRALPEEIRALEWRLGHSTEDSTVAKETLEKKRQTLAALTEVNRSLERADDELRDAAAAIENIYGQLLRMTTARQLPQEAVNRLSAEVEDRAASMKVMADALTATLQGYRRPTD